MQIEYPKSDKIPVSHLPFSPATIVGNIIYVSGQASVDDKGTIVADSFEGEVRRSIENLKRILEACGSDLQHVMKVGNYVRDPDKLGEFNKIYAEYFTAPYPARTTITSCLPASLQYEIDCIALKVH